MRPLILSLDRQGEDIVARFKAGPEGSAHPEEILGALGFDPRPAAAGSGSSGRRCCWRIE